jgi:predicted nucleic acid-binding Zn ribbon protein
MGWRGAEVAFANVTRKMECGRHMSGTDTMPPTQSKASKPCRVCANAIPTQASYCTHCQSYQNWRRHLQFGQTTLSLLVALVAVLSTLVPSAMQLINRPNSRLIASGLSSNAGQLNLTFSNLGDRAGVIDGVVLSYEPATPQTSRSGQLSPVVFEAPENPVVAAGEVRKLAMSVPIGNSVAASWLSSAATLYDKACTVSVDHTAFDGSTIGDRFSTGCRQILSGLSPELDAAFRSVQVARLRANAVILPPPGD